MKKITIVLLFCFLAVLGVYSLRGSDYEAIRGIVKFVSDIVPFRGEEQIVYSRDFKINKLSIKSSDFYYNNLDDAQKLIYSAVANSVKKIEPEVKVPSEDYTNKTSEKIKADIVKAMTAFFQDHPEVFYVSSTYDMFRKSSALTSSAYVKLTYLGDKTAIEKQIDEVDNVITQLANDLPNTNEFEKELFLHDALGKKSIYHTYDKVESIEDKYHNSYSALVENEAVCDGFTRAVQLLLDRAGIESIFISGTLEKEEHAWNMVKIQGDWYHLDLTSNKFIKQVRDNNALLVHSYFNVTDSVIKMSHTIDQTVPLPQATATNYYYYNYMDYYISETSNFEKVLTDIVNRQNDMPLLEFAVGSISNLPEKMSNALFKIRFNGYGTDGNNKLNYYNLNNTYVVIK